MTGNELKDFRLGKKMSRTSFAFVMDLSYETICNMEQRGSGHISERIASRLGSDEVLTRTQVIECNFKRGG